MERWFDMGLKTIGELISGFESDKHDLIALSMRSGEFHRDLWRIKARNPGAWQHIAAHGHQRGFTICHSYDKFGGM